MNTTADIGHSGDSNTTNLGGGGGGFGATSTQGAQGTNNANNGAFIYNPRLVLCHSIIKDCIDKLIIVNYIQASANDFSVDDSVLSFLNSQKQILAKYNKFLTNHLSNGTVNTMNQTEITESIMRDTIHNNNNNNNTRIDVSGQSNKKKKQEKQEFISVSSELRDRTVKLTEKLENNTKKQEVSSNSGQQFLSLIWKLKYTIQNDLQNALNELEYKSDCQNLKKLIDKNKLTMKKKSEISSLVENLKESIFEKKNELTNEMKNFDKKMQTMKSHFVQLKEENKKLKDKIDISQTLQENEYKAKLNTIFRRFHNMEQTLKDELQNMQVLHNTEQHSFKQTQIFFNQKLINLDQSLKKWQKKYEKDTQESTNTLEASKSEREKTLTELHKCQDEYNKEKTMYEARLEAERKKKEYEQLITKSAIMIQKVVRGFLVRNRNKSKKDKGKKGKKGKKDKKGKKGKKKK